MDYHNDPRAMCRVMVQYVSSNERIKREVEATFGSAPCVQDISTMRGTYERSAERRRLRDFDRTVVWMDQRYQDSMDEANQRFVKALYSARRAA